MMRKEEGKDENTFKEEGRRGGREKVADGKGPWWRGRRIEAAFARYGHRADPPGVEVEKYTVDTPGDTGGRAAV